MKIDIPRMLIGLRELQHHEARSRGERLAYWLAKEVLRRPWLYRMALKLARLVLRMRARRGWLARLPGPAAGWTACRDFPSPAARSFRDSWPDLGGNP